ncbi:MAG: AMIN domain-containing protein [Cyanobacteria bacterium CRU_2_1]|nr:AMIN domain-containing protein [Cyanobacteria bacterium RU_5_0]NJR59009.1 AMIN domain-containing protein [Cyanobacteria bacterium CRU_2_1]
MADRVFSKTQGTQSNFDISISHDAFNHVSTSPLGAIATVRIHWLLPSFLGAIGILLFSSAAEAARLQSWQFDEDDYRLTFTTDEGVQPRVQLIQNPTRLVIDLPNTTLGRPRVEEAVGEAIQAVRVAQFDEQTTRIVIELNPGYTIDPQEVRVRGLSPTQWVVELPDPERIEIESPPAESDSDEISQSDQSESIPLEAIEAETQIQELRLTPDGLFIRFTGETPELDEDNREPRRRRPRQYMLELENAALSLEVVRRDIPFDRYGITRIQLVQEEIDDEDDPPVVTIMLELIEDSPEWRAIPSGDRGIVLVPAGGSGILTGVSDSVSLTADPSRQPPIALPVPDQPIPIPTPPPPAATTPPPLPDVSESRVVVAIDPGHGGRDPGAVGINGLQETDIVLDIGVQVASLLEEQGVTVVLTRQDDREIDLEPRVQAANQAGADLFISIHANAISLSRPDVNGVETYYYSDSGLGLAQVIHEIIVDRTDSRDRGIRFARFYVLRNTSMPAVLLEVGFVTGEIDAPRLADPEFRQQMAEAIVAGILQYIQQNF